MRDTRAEILHEAETLVRARGYAGVSYADLADLVGIRKASIHHHFPTKAELAAALLAAYDTRYDLALADILGGSDDGLVRIRAYAALYRQGVEKGLGCLCAAFAAELEALPLPLRGDLSRFFAKHIAWIEAVLADGQRTATIRAGIAPGTHARMIVAALEGALMMERLLDGTTGFAGTFAPSKMLCDRKEARPPYRRDDMSDLDNVGTFALGGRAVKRLGYGAMQLAGPGVFGPPKDHDGALAVLREAVASGVDHIDTSDFYGPHVTNQLIREALHPYPDDLVIVTKVGARRGDDKSWNPAFSAEELTAAVHDNLRNLGVDVLDVVNLRLMFDRHGPAEGSIEAPLTVLAELQRQGLVRHIGLSNATSRQIADGRAIVDIVCVQNQYNLAHRDDDALIDELSAAGIAYVPFFPLGGFSPLQSDALSAVAARHGATPMQVALAWLLRRAPNILLIPGTSSVEHLRENLAAAALELPQDAMAELDRI